MREEGVNWNAYFAMPDAMEDAIFLGSINRRFAENPKHQRAFMALMRECVSDLLEEITGARPIWPQPEGYPAPEHERTKEA